MRQMQKQPISILLMVLLVACGQVREEATLETELPSPAELPATRIFPGSDKTGTAAIVYERNGGLAGISEEWTIYPDGRILSDQGEEYLVSPERVSSLLS